MHLFKKTILAITLLAFTASIVFFDVSAAYAQTPGELQPVKVADQALRGKSCGTSVLGLCVPFTSLDSFAYFIAKVMIQQLTTSIVNWINSGFDGNPSFVTDPGGFFADAIDQEIGKMISNSSDLNFLCSPFNINIRLALAFKYRPFQQRISCTLSQVINNTTGALSGATINGFTAGDFSQGGWNSFLTMTTEPQDNVYGAYIEASDQLEINIGSKRINLSNEINQGKGFLSWKKCTAYQSDLQGPTQPGQTLNPNGDLQQGPTQSGDTVDQTASAANGGKGDCVHEEVQTPGTVIESQLETQLGTGIRQLELADSFNEIVNALVAQLVKQVLTAGLRAASGSSPSDSNSYLNQLQQTQADQAAQAQQVKDQISTPLNSAITLETTYKVNKTASTNQLIGAKNLLDSVKNCYTGKLYTTNYQQASLIQQKINSIDDIVSTKITPLSTPLINDLNIVTANLTQLNQIKQALDVAQNANDAYYPTQNFSSLTQGGTLHTQADVTKSQTERDQITADMQTIDANANNDLKQCQLMQ